MQSAIQTPTACIGREKLKWMVALLTSFSVRRKALVAFSADQAMPL